MLEIINELKIDCQDAKSVKCKEKGINLSLGADLKKNSIILNANKCKCVKEKQKKIIGFKICDCIIISSKDNTLYLNIIELRTKTTIQDNFLKKFLNCLEVFDNWINNKEKYKDLKYKFYFFCVYKRCNSIFIKFLQSINNRLCINGVKKKIEPIKNNECLSDYFTENCYW